MKARVTYIDFHWDNHQGGSGKSFEMSFVIDIPAGMLAGEIKEFIAASVKDASLKSRPFAQTEIATIIQIEIL